MSLDHNPFASKLSELDSEYARMVSSIRLCHAASQAELASAKDALWKDCTAQEEQLEAAISAGRSMAVTELSDMQLHYFRQIREALQEKLPQYLDAYSRSNDASRAEAMALFAEFAIDNAIQGMHYALHAVLSAVELQMTAEETAWTENDL